MMSRRSSRTLVILAFVASFGTLAGGGVLIARGARTATAAAPAAGKPGKAEVVSLADMQKSIKSHKGRVVLLHLWASWCFPCLQELPVMGRFARDMKARGVDVLSFSLDTVNDDTLATVPRLIGEKAENALQKKIVIVDDPDKFVTAVDPKWEGTIPALFAYDQAGALRRSIIGESSRGELDRVVDELLKEGKSKSR